MKVMIVLNTAWNLVNFRAGLIRALVSQGHEVIAVAPMDRYAQSLALLGCRYVPLPMDNKGTHPLKDGLLFMRFLKLLWRERPKVVLMYTIKPNIYGSLAAHCLGIPVINNIAGLGSVFIKMNWLTQMVRLMYRAALRRSATVFFQNKDDCEMFVEMGLVSSEKTDCLPGSGINLKQFSSQGMLTIRPYQDVSLQKKLRFILIARMLWDKGVGEYVQAGRIIKQKYPDVELCLLGFLDVDNPSAISRSQMDDWVSEGVVNYLGLSDDVRQHLFDADCIVLPSYREGLPRSLLEAAAMERPIVTTDAVGCRDVVEHGLNGLICRARDADDLANKMEDMINLTPASRQAMGRQGRLMVERQFDEQIVIDKYFKAIALITLK